MHGTHLEDLTTQIKPRTASNLLLWFVVAFVVAFFLWAGVTELDRTVRGTGRVIPSSQLQIVSNLEGGIVQDILVRSGPAGPRRRRADPARPDPVRRRVRQRRGDVSTRSTSRSPGSQAEIMGRDAGLSARARSRRSPTRSASSRRCTPRAWPISPACSARASARGRARPSAPSPRPRRPIRRASAPTEQRRSEVRIIRPLVERGIEPRLSLIQAESARRRRAERDGGGAPGCGPRPLGRRRGACPASPRRQQRMARAGGDRARHRPGRGFRARPRLAGAGRSRATHRAARAAAGPDQPRPRHHPRRHDPRRRAGGRDRAQRGEPAGRGAGPPADIAFVRIGQPARVAITAYDRSIYGVLEGSVVDDLARRCRSRSGPAKPTISSACAPTQNVLRDATGRRLPIGAGMVAEVDLLGEKRTILQYILSPITRLRETAFREQ